jgi:hypothetical protein
MQVTKQGPTQLDYIGTLDSDIQLRILPRIQMSLHFDLYFITLTSSHLAHRIKWFHQSTYLVYQCTMEIVSNRNVNIYSIGHALLLYYLDIEENCYIYS